MRVYDSDDEMIEQLSNELDGQTDKVISSILPYPISLLSSPSVLIPSSSVYICDIPLTDCLSLLTISRDLSFFVDVVLFPTWLGLSLASGQ